MYEDYYSIYKSSGVKESKEIYTYLEAMDENAKTVEDHLKPIDHEYSLFSCGDFETAKAMMQEKLGYALLPNWVAEPLVKNGDVQKIKLSKLPLSFGQHKVSLSFKTSKKNDSAIKWVSEQTKIMLGI